MTLAHDPYQQVANTARASLSQFPGGGSGLASLLSQQLHSLVSSLPRLIRQHDDNRYMPTLTVAMTTALPSLVACDDRKVATLQLLAGYLGLAGGHVMLMVHSLPHLSRLVQALVQVRPGVVCASHKV